MNLHKFPIGLVMGPNMKSSFLSNFAQDACFGGVGKIYNF